MVSVAGAIARLNVAPICLLTDTLVAAFEGPVEIDGRRTPGGATGIGAEPVRVAGAGVAEAELDQLVAARGWNREEEEQCCCVEKSHGVVPSLRMMKSTTNSTRRFVMRPAAVVLGSAGTDELKPFDTSLSLATPRATR